MPYRTPMVVGDRVALAPHTDLWMAGCRFGYVERIQSVGTDRDDRLVYNVRLDTGLLVALSHDDLLGAVAGTPVGGPHPDSVLGAIRSAVPLLGRQGTPKPGPSFDARYNEDREAGGASPSTGRHAHPYDSALDGPDATISRADCTGGGPHSHVTCPRHNPVYYTDYMARHATDSINPSGRW